MRLGEGKERPPPEGLMCSALKLILDLGSERKSGRVLRWGVLEDVQLLMLLVNYFRLSFLGQAFPGLLVVGCDPVASSGQKTGVEVTYVVSRPNI